jgi:hypothetical protein
LPLGSANNARKPLGGVSERVIAAW